MKKPTDSTKQKPCTAKVIRLSDITDSCFQISTGQAIQDLQEFLSENQKFDKVFLIAVSTEDKEFNYAWFKGKITCSEAIAVLKLASLDQTETLRS